MFGTLSLTVAMTMAACGSSNNDSGTNPTNTPTSHGGSTPPSTLSGTLNGAGSTAQQAAMTAWATGFQTAHSGVTVNYNPIGSGGGVTSFLQKAVTFAGSDAYLTGDPALVKENPGTTLPGTTITPVHRSDESGTSENFTDYLSQAAPSDWTYGPVEDWPIKSGEGADGTSGVIAAVGAGAGTIGYADNSQAGSLGKVSVLVGSKATAPTASAAGAVLSQSSAIGGSRPATDLALNVNRTPTGSGVYPVILVSYQIICQQQSSSTTAALIKAFETYLVSAAGQQAAASQAGSAPIPASLMQQDLAAIKTIK
jgi:phosphate transport system substrate-binding protein